MIIHHRVLLADKIRCNSYKKALFDVVKLGDTVVDIGTGTGLLAYFAVMAGAEKVYAIEMKNIIQDAKKIAKENSWIDRIIFIKDRSTNVQLNQKVDVVISELLSYFAIEDDVVKYMFDAKKRFLKKGGILIPSKVEMKIAPIDSKKVYQNLVGFWGKMYGIDFRSVNEKVLNYRYLLNLSRDDLLASPQKIHTIDFYKLNTEDITINKSMHFKIIKRGVIHGIAGWFDAKLTDQVVISTFLKNGQTHWGTNFFPIEKPISVEKGETISVKISAHKHFGTTIWSWSIENESGVRYSHSLMKSINFDEDRLLRPSGDYIPIVEDKEKEILRFIVDRCNGLNSIGQISKEIMQKYPELFHTLDEAQAKVSKIISNNKL